MRHDVQVAQLKVTVDGRERDYLEVAPVDPSPPPARLLIAMHGSNQTGRRFRRFTARTLEDWAASGAGVVVYPDSWRRGLWNDARRSTDSRARRDGVDDVAFLTQLVAGYRAAGTAHVFALGFSNGGQMVIRMLHDAPEAFDGAALVGATLPAAGNLLPLGEAVRAVPMILMHGTKDPIVPFEGGVASLFGFRPRGEMRSFADSVDYWVERAHLTVEPVISTLQRPGRAARTSTRRSLYAEAGRPPVIAYATSSGGHVVPHRLRRGWSVMGRWAPEVDTMAVLDLAFSGR